MTGGRHGNGMNRPHWLAALSILLFVMVIVPLIARFY
ncbi:hypothetical protein HNP60_000323 [Sphingobium sp. B1D3A]|uniref:Uncharacterized protein n=1 Tax=Sphingobium lignivorans TaxID=2735886 RepID=A0ABR6NAP7_9SPHN|nr:hypothetical protein [Sphingobium lignivorans]